MASPTPQDAINFAKRDIGNSPIDDTNLLYRVLNDANCQLWMAAPWLWTVGTLEEVTVVNGTQDVSLAGTYTTLMNLLHLNWTDGQTKKDIQVSSSLPSTTSLQGTISQGQYIAGSPNKIRFYPVPAGYATGTKVNGYYKLTAPVIAAGNISTALSSIIPGFHDEWFWVFQELVLLKAYRFIKDPREGSVQVGPNGTAYTGQHAIAQAAIQTMMQGEEKFYKTLGEVVQNG